MFREDLEQKLDKLWTLDVNYAACISNNDPKLLKAKQDESKKITAEIIEGFNRPRVSVGVMIFKGARGEPPQILMEKRKHRHGHGEGEWSLIGGWMENGETWEQTALREAYEEVGVRAEGGRLVTATVTTTAPDRHFVTGVVVLRNWHLSSEFMDEHTEPFPREPDKVHELRWVPLADIVEGKITPLFAPVANLAKELKTKSVLYEFDIDEIYKN